MIEKIIESLYWLRIVASPLVAGVALGFLCKIYFDNDLGDFLFGFLSVAGLALGIYFANKMKKKYGASTFMSKVNASPDIDEAVKDKKFE